LPDLFPGAPLVIRNRYRGTAPATAQISATDGAGAQWTEFTAAKSDPVPAIRVLWARDQVRALEDEYAIGRGDQPALAARIVECSLRHKVLSRFTAFVAVDHSEIVNAGGERKQIIQPVDAPDGWDMIGDVVESVDSFCAELSRGAMPRAYLARSSDAFSDFAPRAKIADWNEEMSPNEGHVPPAPQSLRRKQGAPRFDLPALRH